MLVSLWALTKLWPIILLIVTAFIFHAALLPYVEWLVARRVPRTLSVLAIMFAIIAALGGLSALVVPAMVDEFVDLRDNLRMRMHRTSKSSSMTSASKWSSPIAHRRLTGTN